VPSKNTMAQPYSYVPDRALQCTASERSADRRTDDSMMPKANHILCNSTIS